MTDIARLTSPQASSFAFLALAGVTREFPHKPDHVLNSAADARTPKDLHPAFYGCYDWHSSVHSHWMLVRLLRLFPALPEASAMRAVLSQHLSPSNLAAELAYVQQPGRLSFERPYGWAWFFKLVEELHAEEGMSDSYAAVQPLADCFAERLIDWLPRQRHPIRTGVHSNTAFVLAFGLDYARALGNEVLEKAIIRAASRFFGEDRDAPVSWEPSGNDFFSPALMEADLMRRVMEPAAFEAWLTRLLPTLTQSGLLIPVLVTDRGDAQGVHLDGLNLSRAWCLKGIAAAAPLHKAALIPAAQAHLNAGLAHVESGDFLGEHWLGTFAVYALTA